METQSTQKKADGLGILGGREVARVEDAPPTAILFQVMGLSGDRKQMWDPNQADEVDDARRSFSNLRKKGFLAYKVNPKDGSKGEQITEFDPAMGAVIFTPPMVGG